MVLMKNHTIRPALDALPSLESGDLSRFEGEGGRTPPPVLKPVGVPKRSRRLKGNELVTRGDFVANEQRGFEPWEGPTGFRADAFMKPVYRRWGGVVEAIRL
jgi:hypothetical protein